MMICTQPYYYSNRGTTAMTFYTVFESWLDFEYTRLGRVHHVFEPRTRDWEAGQPRFLYLMTMLVIVQ